MVMNAADNMDIEKLFGGRQEAFPPFNTVRKYVETLGEVKTEAIKTQVSFGAQRRFAWVLLPDIWMISQLRSCVALSFDLPSRVKDPRIKQSLEQSPGHWVHQLIIRDEADLDDAVKGWLKEAYAQAGVC